jgi:hypothetical protein
MHLALYLMALSSKIKSIRRDECSSTATRAASSGKVVDTSRPFSEATIITSLATSLTSGTTSVESNRVWLPPSSDLANERSWLIRFVHRFASRRILSRASFSSPELRSRRNANCAAVAEWSESELTWAAQQLLKLSCHRVQEVAVLLLGAHSTGFMSPKSFGLFELAYISQL